MECVSVYLIGLPVLTRGITVYYFGDDGQAYYSVFINSRLSFEMQCKAYDHEISHINNSDFDSMLPVDELESLRHAM